MRKRSPRIQFRSEKRAQTEGRIQQSSRRAEKTRGTVQAEDRRPATKAYGCSREGGQKAAGNVRQSVQRSGLARVRRSVRFGFGRYELRILRNEPVAQHQKRPQRQRLLHVRKVSSYNLFQEKITFLSADEYNIFRKYIEIGGRNE